MLQTTKQIMILLCMLPAEASTKATEKISNIAVTLSMFSVLVFSSVSFSIFIWKNIRIDFEAALVAVLQNNFILSGIYVFVSVFFLREKLYVIFEKLTTIRNNRK